MNSETAGKSPDGRRKRAATGGTAVIWPAGVEERYGITPWTRWRWERDGRLPPRDVNLNGKSGWRPETLSRAESGAQQPAP